MLSDTIQELEKALKILKIIEEKKVSFDFDELLDEIDNLEVPEIEVKQETPETKQEADEAWEAVDADINGAPEAETGEIEDAIEPEVKEEDVKEFFTDKAIKESKIEATKKAYSETLSVDTEIDYSDEFKDMMQEVKKYYKDVYAIQQEIDDLKSQIKERKQEAKDIGIKTAAVDKAMKEVISNIKESSEDAKAIEDAKRYIENDDELYNIAVIKAG